MKYLVLACITLASIPLPVNAGAIDEAMKSGVLRVCTPGDYKPFSFALPDIVARWLQ